MTDVCIAVGHGRKDDGRYDPGAADGVHNEQRDAKPVARACTLRLRERYGLVVASEHEMADDPAFRGTTRWANRLKPKCIVSFHYDWNKAPLGAFMIATSDAGRRLGWAIEAQVKQAGFAIRDYPDDRDNLYLLNNTTMPAVIFECGRIGSEPVDEVHEQEALGRAAADGIADYLGVEPRKDDDMPLTDQDKNTIRTIVREEVRRNNRRVWEVDLPITGRADVATKPAWLYLGLRLLGLLERFDRVPRDVAEEFAEGIDIDLTVKKEQ